MEFIFAHIKAGNGPPAEFGPLISVGLRVVRLPVEGFQQGSIRIGNGPMFPFKDNKGGALSLHGLLYATDHRFSNSGFIFRIDVYLRSPNKGLCKQA